MGLTEKQRKLHQSWLDATRKYDSDEDLPAEAKTKIEEAARYGRPGDEEKVRKSEWEKQGSYSKLKKALKSGFWGDKRSE